MAAAIPVILIGRMGQMGRLVAQNLKPEIEVIHFISSPEVASKDLPRMLNRQRPSEASGDGIGSQDYSKEPAAVLLGLGYTNETVEDIRQACSRTTRSVPWIRGGLSNSEFNDVMAKDTLLPIPEQAPITAGKVKNLLLQVLKDGHSDKDGVYDWWKL